MKCIGKNRNNRQWHEVTSSLFLCFNFKIKIRKRYSDFEKSNQYVILDIHKRTELDIKKKFSTKSSRWKESQ